MPFTKLIRIGMVSKQIKRFFLKKSIIPQYATTKKIQIINGPNL